MVECKLKSGEEIYPHRPDLYDLKMYECPHCHGRVGVHKGATKPLGCIPTPEMKRARIIVHNLIDPLWRSGKIERGRLYKMLSDELGYPYHTGETKSIEELREVYKAIIKIKKNHNGLGG